MSEYEMTQKGGRERAVHILLAERLLGRPLKENEVVHHINGDKTDNRLENLRVMERGEHTRLHKTGVTPGADTVKKLREVHKGTPSKTRKLNREQTRDIAERLQKGELIRRLAKDNGVSCNIVRRIRDGTAYRDWLEDYPDDAFPLQEKKMGDAAGEYHSETAFFGRGSPEDQEKDSVRGKRPFYCQIRRSQQFDNKKHPDWKYL